ncbi:hypothetical protein RFI_19420, partial [Reticulomyxa filosa]
LPFDKQLQIASFNRRDMANLMFYFPNKFRHSSFIHSLGPNGENFISQMANNSNVTYDYANLLFYNGDFFSDEFVQSQLITADENGTYPLMYAVSKQRSIECIKLFVPSNEKSKYSVWNSLNNVKKRMYNIYAYITNEITKCFKKQSCIGLAVRNTNVNVLELLNWLKAEIDKDNWQKFIEIQDINVCYTHNQGLTPLMNALTHQSELNDNIIQVLIPKDFKENYTFWECKCNKYGVNTFFEEFLFIGKNILHLMFENALPNVEERLRLMKEYVPDESWENLVVTPDEVELKERNKVHYVFANNKEQQKPRFLEDHDKCLSDNFNGLEGLNMIHLVVSSENINAFGNLKCLQEQMPLTVWKELLDQKNKVVYNVVCGMKEKPFDAASRLRRSDIIKYLRNECFEKE